MSEPHILDQEDALEVQPFNIDALNDELLSLPPSANLAAASGFAYADVSRWQGAIDWAKFPYAGVILKAGGSDAGRYTDRAYADFARVARAHGKHLGHYWFNGAGDPATDAAYFVAHLASYKDEDLVVLDIEGASAWSPAKALTWFKAVRKAKPKARLVAYMSASVTRAEDWSAVVAYGVELWVASYGSNTGSKPAGTPSIAHWSEFLLWQFTSIGHVAGISGDVDLDWAPGNVWAAAPAPKPSPTPAPKPKPVTYTVESGDNLSSIAAHFHTTWSKLYAANRARIGSNPNAIYPGLVLTIPS